MDRRTYLRSLGVASGVATAGCLGSVPGIGTDRTVLGSPDRDHGAASYPAHGDDLPDFRLPDPLLGEEITPGRFEDDRAVLMTFFYTSCPDGVCPMLVQRLVNAQVDAAERGYEDDVAFLAVTFDPERDTADVLADHADRYGIDLEAGNWHYLRPESYDRARAVVDGEFGNPVEKVDPEDHPDHDADDHDHGEYTFTHYDLILLANERGIVERPYPQATGVGTSEIVADLRTVVED